MLRRMSRTEGSYVVIDPLVRKPETVQTSELPGSRGLLDKP